MEKKNELHLHLDDSDICITNYFDTELAVLSNQKVVHTTITHFLSWKYRRRLFVHFCDKVHEITLGKCEGTGRYIREGHNIEKMLMNGEFDWF